jgi:hypothetical protein
LELAGFIGMSGWLPFQQDILDVFNQYKNDAKDMDYDEDDPFGHPDDGEDDPGREEVHCKDPTVRVVLFQRDQLSIGLQHDIRHNALLCTPVFLGHEKQMRKSRFLWERV